MPSRSSPSIAGQLPKRWKRRSAFAWKRRSKISKASRRSPPGQRKAADPSTIEVHAEYDVREVLTDVKTKVDAIDTFPQDVEKPVISELSAHYQVINVAIAGNAELAMLKRLGERVRDELIALPENLAGRAVQRAAVRDLDRGVRGGVADAGG